MKRRSAPITGYYMTLEVSYLDLGAAASGEREQQPGRGSAMSAHGVIIKAGTGHVVAEVKFSQSSGWSAVPMFEPFMSQIGGSLADWFKERRAAR